MTTINILTRTGSRPSFYKELKKSIETQTYKKIRHIKSNDNPNCMYLKNEKDVINVLPNKNAGHAFYNLYLNELIENVTDGWIIILDDDSKLIDDKYIEKIANECDKSLKNDILIYPIKINPPAVILPNKNLMEKKELKAGRIDMACFCFHSSLSKEIKFDGRRGGDYKFLDKVRSFGGYNFKFTNLSPGIWANYKGARNGK